jgi:hypothetical protein
LARPSASGAAPRSSRAGAIVSCVGTGCPAPALTPRLLEAEPIVTSPSPNTPRIDRAALDRIIQRATELQTSDREIGDNLTPEEVLELGKDVGIPAKYLQRAMLEHRSAADVSAADRTVLGRLVGPGEIQVQRVVQGDPDLAMQGLLAWMERHELLVVQRQQAGWVSWEPLRGMQAAIRRGTASLDTSKPKFMLTKADLVTATVSLLEPGYSQVTLVATVRRHRQAAMGGGFAGLSLGLAGAIVAGTLSPFAVVAVPPLLVGGVISWFALRSFRPVVERVQLGLERALDFLERGGAKPGHDLPTKGPGLIELLAGEVRRALTPPPKR